jgi:protein-disulfide isomerase
MSNWTRRELLGTIGASGGTIVGGYYGLGLWHGYTPPTCDSAPPAALDAPTLGDPSAPVTVAVYTDYSCPHCREYALSVFPHLRREYIDTGVIRYEHHDYPVPVDQWSRPAANAAREIQHRAGNTAFFAYATALYQHQDEFANALFGTLAETVNVRAQPVEQAARSGAYCQLLNTERRRARERGIKGTPTIVVNDQILEAPSLIDVTTAISQQHNLDQQNTPQRSLAETFSQNKGGMNT